MRTSADVGAKNFKFFEIYGMSARTRGVVQCGHFSDKGEGGQFFAILCGRLLWTAPYCFLQQQRLHEDIPMTAPYTNSIPYDVLRDSGSDFTVFCSNSTALITA